MKKLKIQMGGRSDEFQTPKYAIFPLLPYLDKKWNIFECAWGKGSLAKHFEEEGFNVYGNKAIDFLESDIFPDCFDIIITNPPYSIKDGFIEKCYSLKKPFALLMPLTALEGIKRGKMYRENGLQIIIPNRRINFITPSGKGSGAWFQTAWFCWGLDLPKDIMFIELEREVKKEGGR